MGHGGAGRGGEWNAGFLYLGNHLMLDMLNTRPAAAGDPIELLFDFGALLRWFAEAGVISRVERRGLARRWSNSARAQETLEIIRRLREELRQAVLLWERAEKVPARLQREVNRLMARHPMLTRVKENKRGLTAERWFRAREPEDLIAPLVHSAANLFVEADRNRVRKCGHCVAHFLDTSKKGGRRWCSMGLCGNRLKVAAYAARKRSRR